MADDPTTPPKPTPRRRRAAKPKVPTAAPASSSTVEPGVIEPAGSEPGADPVALDHATEAAEDGAAVDGSAMASADLLAVDSAAAAGDVDSDDAWTTTWPLLDGRSPSEWVCPFLRSIDDQGRPGQPLEAPGVANRCASQPELMPQSLRQQELVCLTTAHVDCPRYLRGAEAAIASEVEPVRARTTPIITPAMLGALTLLAAAFTASVVFTLARGGLDLPAAAVQRSPAPSASVSAIVPTAETSATPGVEVSAVPSPSEITSPLPTPTPAASVSPSGSPDPGSPTPAPTPAASPTSDRYALLTACPDKPDCWLYRVRTGDNLFSIANYFGVPLAKVKALNPWTANGLRAGRDLILPPPTR